MSIPATDFTSHLPDLGRVAPHQEWRQVASDHGQDRAAALATGIGVARALLPVLKANRCCDQLEVAVIAVLGVRQDLLERNLKEPGVDSVDLGHWRQLSH